MKRNNILGVLMYKKCIITEAIIFINLCELDTYVTKRDPTFNPA